MLPVSAIVLNGSLSWDDLAIVKWNWIREPNSLAAGNIILNSDSSPILIVSKFYVCHRFYLIYNIIFNFRLYEFNIFFFVSGNKRSRRKIPIQIKSY